MEKFALLNLLKVIDGLKNAQTRQNTAAETTPPTAEPPVKHSVSETADNPIPNLMYETLMRHEQISNRLKNKKH